MARPDADNEIVRRRNAMVMADPRQVLLCGLAPQAAATMGRGWGNCILADAYEDHVQALRGVIRRPTHILRWGRTNLGVGLYRARQERKCGFR